jgi:phosphate transport system protein
MKHVIHQIDRLKERVLALGSLAETAIAEATTSLANREAQSAKRAIERHAEVELAAADIEEECVKTLALYHPAVGDLRLVVAVLKIKGELRRIAELAKNIAKRTNYLIDTQAADVQMDFRPMASHAQEMVRKSLDALVRGESGLAHDVRRDDDALDSMRRHFHQEIRGLIREHPEQTEPLLKLYAVAKHLERIGDMATNIAADVIYMLEGEIVRHRDEE